MNASELQDWYAEHSAAMTAIDRAVMADAVKVVRYYERQVLLKALYREFRPTNDEPPDDNGERFVVVYEYDGGKPEYKFDFRNDEPSDQDGGFIPGQDSPPVTYIDLETGDRFMVIFSYEWSNDA